MSKALSCEQLLERLVGFDTTSSKANRPLIDFIRDYLDGFGVKSHVLSADGNKANIWATIGKSDKPGIVLAGHSDVVPVDGQNWTSDPFKLTKRNGKFYGRGSCDMKAFIACSLSILPELVKADLKQPVHFAFTHDEETDMSGAAKIRDYLRKEGVKPAWVWIIDAHKGVAAFETKITGVPGHSSMPDKGQNAIETATDFMGILRRVAKARRDKPFSNSRFDPAFTTMNLGTITGGTAENIIAEHCDVLWQVRAHPGDTAEAFQAEVDRIAKSEIAPRFAAFAPHAGMKTCVCFDIPPLTPTANNPGEKILTQLTGHNQTQAVSFGTEAGFFQSLGTHVVVCGPGSIGEAHKADEFVAENQLKSCVDVLGRVLISSRPN
jgi:acetylornithine deacetylase